MRGAEVIACRVARGLQLIEFGWQPSAIGEKLCCVDENGVQFLQWQSRTVAALALLHIFLNSH
jgi:hypothetical protein